MENSINISTFKAAVAVLFSFAMIVTTAIITILTTVEVSAQSADRIFESEEGDYRLQIPQGWVIEDGGIIQANDDPTVEDIAILCLQNEALPDIGGEYNCQAANTTDAMYILSYPDLQSNPALENVENITTNDLLALRIHELQNYTSAKNIQLENVTDGNISGGFEKKILDMAYSGTSKAGTFLPFDDFTYEAEDSVMFVLAEDKNTGYAVIYPRSEGEIKAEAALQQVFDSFELIAANNTTNVSNATTTTTTTATTPTLSPLQQQEQQIQSQQQGGEQQQQEAPTQAGTTSIAILQGAAVQGSPDFDPDAAQLPLDNKIVWDNQDTVPHTATSGTGPNDPNSGKLFDTSIINGGEESIALELKGVSEGQTIPYYCMIHPYMTGQLTVEAAAAAAQSAHTGGGNQTAAATFDSEGGLVKTTNKGTLDIRLEPVWSEGGQATFNVSFLNAGTEAVHQHQDYDFRILKDSQQVFSAARETGQALLHNVEGTVTIPYTFQENGAYSIQVYLAGTGIAPTIPTDEEATFSITVPPEFPNGVLTGGGNQTATSATTSITGSSTTMRTTGAAMNNETGATNNTETGANGGGGAATSVSIVPGSSSLTDTAFSPNPVQVSVGDTVTWTNDDTQPHTVVSGANAQPSGEFDSSPNFNPLIAPGATFEHTFTQAGDYPYYCALHPNMVGTVIVG